MAAKILKNLITITLVLIIFSIQFIEAKKSSRRPITDLEVRERKQSCYSDIELGYWGKDCKSSMVAKENCALKCLSPACYELIYESDPLEEGEKDYVRSSEYKYCMHSGYWGKDCKSSMVAKENCALKCLSPACYELIYESDPLEEGEKDYIRSSEYKYCMHRLSLGESLDGVRGSFE